MGDINELRIPFQFEIIMNVSLRIGIGAYERIAARPVNIVKFTEDHFVSELKFTRCNIFLYLSVDGQYVIAIFINKRSLERWRRKNDFVFERNGDGIKSVS